MKTHAFPLQLAREAILLERYSDTLSLLKPLASDNLDTQFLLAYLHFWDDELSRTDAIQLMSKIADAGHAEANYILASCPDLLPSYAFSMPNDMVQFERLKRASELGSVTASTDLADCYLQGKFVQKDAEKARSLLSTAFDNSRLYESHVSKNCFLLGKMLLLGIGGDIDIDQALRKLANSVQAIDGLYAKEAIAFIKSQNLKHEIHDIDVLIVELETHHTRRMAKPYTAWQGYLHSYCLDTLIYDLRGISVEACMDFVFDHYPRLLRDRDSFRWDRKAEVIFSPPELLGLYTEMFKIADVFSERYDEHQINQGFGMQGIRGWANWTIGCLMNSASSPVEVVEACIHSMYDLFAKLFHQLDFYEVAYMWWDIGYGACGHSWREDPTVVNRIWTDEVSQRLAQATFDTVVKVLNLDSSTCQEAAIHALQHSHHPEKINVLRKYLRENPDLPHNLRESALSTIIYHDTDS